MNRDFMRKNDELDTQRQALIQEFFAFCEAHPGLRLWQALSAWAGGDVYLHCVGDSAPRDTFYFEGRNE